MISAAMGGGGGWGSADSIPKLRFFPGTYSLTALWSNTRIWHGHPEFYCREYHSFFYGVLQQMTESLSHGQPEFDSRSYIFLTQRSSEAAMGRWGGGGMSADLFKKPPFLGTYRFVKLAPVGFDSPAIEYMPCLYDTGAQSTVHFSWTFIFSQRVLYKRMESSSQNLLVL